RGPPGRMASGPQPAAVDEPGGVRRAAAGDGDAGAAGAGGATGVPHQVVRRGDDAAGPRGVPGRGAGGPVPGPVVCGDRFAFIEAGDEDGRAAVQEAGHGPQGVLGAPVGSAPGPGDDGRGGASARAAAPAAELPGGASDGRGVPG